MASTRSMPTSRRSISRPGSHSPPTCASASAAPAPLSRFQTIRVHAMYVHDDFARTLIAERVAEFRDQVRRRLSGELTEDEFKLLRLQNGVYLQLHAYMLRISIPYGTLSSEQMRALAHVARRYD